MFETFKAVLSNTFKQWMDSYNALIEKIESLPLPIEFGSNTQMQFLKFANGKAFLFGRIDMGTKYPCHKVWGAGYGSDDFSISFPIPLTKADPVIIPHVMREIDPDTIALTRAVTYTTYTGCFYCTVEDGADARAKQLNLLVIGDWK